MNEKRAISIDRIFGIGNVLNLDSEIIHLSVNILDNYIDPTIIIRKTSKKQKWEIPNIEIICVCCIRIAIKFYSDILKPSYKTLSHYISQYSPIECFIKTEELILEKINYIIPLTPKGTYFLEFIKTFDLTKQKNRDIRFNMLYLTDYLLFFPEIYYYINKITLIVGIGLISLFIYRKKKSIFNENYPGISSFYKIRRKILTSNRYINTWMMY